MFEFSVTLIVAFLMVATILSDLRFMRIPNYLSLIGIAAFFALLSWSLPFEETLWRVGTAAACLVIGFVLFVIRVMGAGDVKIMSVLMLFVPTDQLAPFMLMFSGAMVLGIVAVVSSRKFLESADASWAFLRNEKRLPMGLSIGLAGIAQLIVG